VWPAETRQGFDFSFSDPQITPMGADYKTKNLRSSVSSVVKNGF
jgi:hypothetical protein